MSDTEDKEFTTPENPDDASENSRTDDFGYTEGDEASTDSDDSGAENEDENDAGSEFDDDSESAEPDDAADDVPAGAPAPARPYVSGAQVPRHLLQGMYQNWFLEYASYVILERAVPSIEDGLKPVQRRILHSMKTLDDGRFNKVANIVGNTMQYHPHGDASIGDALVQLGQKDLLVETQGNWGNILTGASAAAPRYIEARLSLFALDVLYNPKITEWTLSYDGRKKEPVTLPAKFPLLLAQGAEGIAVGLSSKILPHNFNELIDAAVAYLRGEDFTLYPDFVTGGMIDVSRYNDGQRGGTLKIRSKIEKVDNRTLAITEIPYGKTTGTLIDSILKAFEKGKIKIRKVEDLTAENPRILVHLQPGTSSDKAIDALYAFSDCEVSVSPNCCVIEDRKPRFLGVSDVLRHSADTTMNLLRRELQITIDELSEQLFFASLERFFIEKRIYKDKAYEQAADLDAAIAHVDERLEPIKKKLLREVTRDDILRLFEIKMKRILRFNSDEADQLIANLQARINENADHLEHIVDYTIDWYERLKEKYGEAYPRRTVIRNFNSIEATQVAEANEKLYFNKEEGFIGTGLKRDENTEVVCSCSSIDDIILFYRDGRYKVIRVADKIFVGKNIIHMAVFKRNDNRTHYNVIYQNGRGGAYFMKRFVVTGITRDKEYNLTQDRPDKPVPGSRVVWFTANPNGEAEVVRVTLKPKLRLKKLQFDVDFGELAPKGRQALGNLVTRNEVHRFSLKEKGQSTLGGRQVWFDHDVLRLNYDGRGELLGEFQGNDRILVVLKNGEYYTSTYEETNHYEDNILRIEKFRPGHIYTAVLYDADNGGFPYIKRFSFEPTQRHVSFIGDNPKSRLVSLTDAVGARFSVTFAAPDDFREPIVIDAATFIAVKSLKAKGKRLTAWTVDTITEIEPDPTVDIPDEVFEEETDSDADADMEIEPERSDSEVRDEITGQQRLFTDESKE
ncbi:MAG: DNA gyrase/topoisomerase IV subunit A [Muribaculaceae bacterium]|nr:DNA gyrase/topoisomerase IV subunit A [Muribaculaceae bacterium]